MQKTFIVDGMTCAACSSAVERIMNRSDAVQSASVNLTTKKLNIEYDDQALTVDDIIGKIEKAGFKGQELVETKEIVMPIEGMT
jgi:Cu+-exporting ATPase